MNATPRVLSQVIRSIKHSKLVEEAHPFFIYPAKQAAYPTSAKFFAQRLGRTARTYVPMMIVFFGWPFAAQQLVTATGGP